MDGVCYFAARSIQLPGFDGFQVVSYGCGFNQYFSRPCPVAVFPILFYAGDPKRFPGLHINVITAACATSLPFELNQSATIEVQSSSGFGPLHVRNPCGAVVGMATLEFDVA